MKSFPEHGAELCEQDEIIHHFEQAAAQESGGRRRLSAGVLARQRRGPGGSEESLRVRHRATNPSETSELVKIIPNQE